MIWQEMKVAIRMLRRAPAVTLPAILVLALGIGSATTLYTVGTRCGFVHSRIQMPIG